MNAKLYPARQKKHRGRDVITGLLIFSVSIGLFSVMTATIITCYAKNLPKSENPTPLVATPIGASTTIMRTNLQTEIMHHKVEKTLMGMAGVATDIPTGGDTHAEGERVTRLSGMTIDFYSEEMDYPEEMKRMLKLAQENEGRATVYLAYAEMYECENNVKVQETGEGEVTHIFNKWNTDLDEMEQMLYETYPFYPYTENDVVRLASIIHSEAGSDFVSDAHQRDVASVPINRVLQGGFGGSTIGEVIDAPNQYPATHNNRKYNEREWNNALYVLQHGPTTTGTYQANFVVSTAEEVLVIYDYRDKYPTSRPTYICR